MDLVNIRPAKQEDMKFVHEMIQELADFEKMPTGPKLSEKDLIKDGFSKNPAFRCFVAVVSDPSDKNINKPVGFALTYYSYSTWEGKSLFLEDLYVKPAYRCKGIAEKLIKFIAKMAVVEGLPRLDLHVLDWNPARKFYEKFGFTNLSQKEGWMYYRLDGTALENINNI